MRGYKDLVQRLYAPRNYYERAQTLLSRLTPLKDKLPLSWDTLMAMARCFFWLGLVREGRGSFWKTFFWTCFHRPKNFQVFLMLAIFGYHFRRVYGGMIAAWAAEAAEPASTEMPDRGQAALAGS